ncbi:tRNA (adenosine(37)-N6)-threonylcarbamoyltransferase complex dimerization subunit type 1 TsaB [Acinetobacter sp. MD2(2019)]|uniref:tRNA (adenosine(37)-N6)-threonylcarbamoyltransferase complex dimerization subunit type 1 TsaB n=1 Tax=Acinetobacter sp. MD2(2019) TaxID=2605273 RepID=UPI002D1F7B81|nr:tRNA (adenosine(37)-N6)-threonylcarbamoyltransferase complex dimerization subunit type 1 TsaB [Acinetobacter sp. MD2(2019)]MEB3754551.1 tRNA (adenosine(37)-N6)-threonylcarbamoyltransferase complex dimerization subunit type 1 TsaB [Acinetobacter sp. MD2(2019)]
MKLLALETANEQCSVCLVNDDQPVFFQLDNQAKAQTRTLLPLIEQGLQQNDWQTSQLDVIAFSRGPGSFSGVRINAAVTQALAWANDLPVVAVSTLQALAQAAYRLQQLTQVTAVLDARMQEVYIANFVLDAHGIMQAVSEEKLLSYAAAQAEIQFTVVGSGAHLLQPENTFGDITPTAQDIASIAIELAKQQHWVSAEQALPVYLRDNAWKKIPEQGKP